MLLGPALLKARMPTAAVAMGICIAAPALIVNQWSTVAAFVVGGTANGLFNTGITSTIFRGVQQDEQGRAWSAFSVLAGVCALLGYLIGAATGAGHAREVMLVSGALPAAFGLIALVSLGRARPSCRSGP
jgi:hypothetical protein